MKRKKRLEKGIESIQHEIDIHKDKLKEAEAKGLEELTDYYERDIQRLENQKQRKKFQLEG